MARNGPPGRGRSSLPFCLSRGVNCGQSRGMTQPDYQLEAALAAQGHIRIAGVDEVGRGPLAGPVVAAAVVLDPGAIPEGLNDSKKLTAARRERLYDILHANAQVSIAEASVEEIDALNILRASHLAMERAVAALNPAPDFLLIDGNLIPAGLSCPAEAVIKGDGRSVSIAAASIVAKTWRDRLMVDLAQQHPGYGWERNAGYPTKEHRSALQNLGVTPHHRRSFKTVHKILYQE
ncbi:ribonuclease HII [Ruegeria pomeroyi DSS-3]|uniref:Ribonuclease HII n=2 Tax=Ruegeria pomeroyi TaxID=89184 RepID=RNH2_RUEPO|nr:RecName: Full=Ribonuclease HII; Short=RNase HII [Ruegeria pomeroyi DSS-3]AAV96678.1 ribonuclease HII [Ruegeria pomeroyi DSS-3]